MHTFSPIARDTARYRRPAAPRPHIPVFSGLVVALPLGLACWALLIWAALRLLG